MKKAFIKMFVMMILIFGFGSFSQTWAEEIISTGGVTILADEDPDTDGIG